MSSHWVWVDLSVVLALHDEHLTEHGGASGVRDHAALEAALARPRNKAEYGDADIATLAAAYAYGISCNHPFLDGSKRTALIVAELFLMLNGHVLTASDADCVITFFNLASGAMTEDSLAQWFRSHIAPLDE